jgi:hypothetical protein
MEMGPSTTIFLVSNPTFVVNFLVEYKYVTNESGQYNRTDHPTKSYLLFLDAS